MKGLARLTRADALLALLLVVAALGWSFLTLGRVSQISVQDEWTYIDYAYKASAGHVPAPGEHIGAYTAEAWSCRGSGVRPHIAAPCTDGHPGSHLPLPFRGENYNSFHPPLFLTLAGLTGRLFAAFGADFISGARFFSGLIGALGVLACFAAFRMWRIGSLASFAGALLVFTTPAIAGAAATVHTDSVNILAGAAGVWFGARLARGNLGWRWPALVTVLISLSRTLAVVPMLSVTLVVVLAAIWPRLLSAVVPRRRALAILVSQGLAVAVPYAGWAAIQKARTPAGYVATVQGISTSPMSRNGWTRTLRTLVDVPDRGPFGLTEPGRDYHLPPQMQWAGTDVWGRILWIVYIALFIWAFVAFVRTRSTRLRTGPVVAGPYLTTLIVQGREIALHNMFFRRLSGRYAVVTAPQHALLLATLADRPRLRPVFVAFAVAGYVLMCLGPILSGR